MLCWKSSTKKAVSLHHSKAKHSKPARPLPSRLLNHAEKLSNCDLSSVRIYTNSKLPSLLGARGFARGTEIHLSEGSESLLAHETWHVAQQLQGRVASRFRVGDIAVNKDENLENEANNFAVQSKRSIVPNTRHHKTKWRSSKLTREPVVQGDFIADFSTSIRAPLTRSLFDWVIRDREARRVVDRLNEITSRRDFLDTVNLMQAQGLWGTLIEQAPNDPQTQRLIRRAQSLGIAANSEEASLATIQTAVARSKSSLEAVRLTTTNSRLHSRLNTAIQRIERVEGLIGQAQNTLQAAKHGYDLYQAAQALDNIDISQNPSAAARQFDRLFSSFGKLGNALPTGPWSPYFDFLSQMGNFFENMERVLNPSTRYGPELRRYMP